MPGPADLVDASVVCARCGIRGANNCNCWETTALDVAIDAVALIQNIFDTVDESKDVATGDPLNRDPVWRALRMGADHVLSDLAKIKRPLHCCCSRPGGRASSTGVRRRRCGDSRRLKTPCRCACHRPGTLYLDPIRGLRLTPPD